MKIKVSDYIADFWAKNGIKDIFAVVGGGAMHMNDSFGHHPQLHCIYNHHEQASAMAAEAYYRVNNCMAGLCVTSGPGAINALNGVVGAFQDSIPMMIVSGQTKTSLMTCNSGLNLRTLGNQEFDIMSTLSNVAKYYETVFEAGRIKYCLEKAFYLATNGRPGPCWLEVPIDIQGSYIETEELEGYPDFERDKDGVDVDLFEDVQRNIDTVISKLAASKRPVIYAGNGIRISKGVSQLNELAEKLQIPIVTCWDSIDLAATDNPLYCGRAGIMGDRAGNFAVQNSDFLLCIGTRLNVYQVGYQPETWARNAYVIAVDIDREELKKKTVRINLPICYDAKEFMTLVLDRSDSVKKFDKNWISVCNQWKEKYPVVCNKHYEQATDVNVYALIDQLSRLLKPGSFTVVANGSASVVGSAAYYIGEGSRFLMNCALSSMGYEIPAAIGVSIALNKKEVVCIAGDGSIQMNLQELQTIVTNKLPIKIVLINNQGYHQIRQTQTNLFAGEYVGIGPQSDDLEFPDMEKIAYAYGITYLECTENSRLKDKVNELLNADGCCILEAFCDIKQFFEPKSSTRRLEDGTLVSPPLEDLAPFLSREELAQNMLIDMV